MPPPYLIQVASQPSKVSHETWTQWYLEEHLRDMVYFGVAKTAAFYRASSGIVASGESEKHIVDESWPFLVLFQTEREKGLSFPAFREKVRQSTELFDGRRGREVARLEDEEVKFVGVSQGQADSQADADESAAPHIVKIKVFVSDNDNDSDNNMLRSAYVAAASKVTGYRRTLVYRPPQPTSPNFVLLTYEFTSLSKDGFADLWKDVEAASAHEGTSCRLRSFELLGSEGFGGECRTPARL